MLPRALQFPVMAMARPRRPAAEIAAVCEAAELVQTETSICSAQGLGREIARRVIELLLDDNRNDPMTAMADMAMDPISALAFGEGFGAVDELAAVFRDRMLSNYGSSIVVEFQQQVQRELASKSLSRTLSRRYAKIISCHSLPHPSEERNCRSRDQNDNQIEAQS